MKRNVFETLLGAVILAVAGAFLAYSYDASGVKAVAGYEITADFSGVGGLKAGDDVQISGVKVGTVTGIHLNPETYMAEVRMSIDPSIKLPTDTFALISNQSLLGGRYLALEPGADDAMIEAGGKIFTTQAPQNLEQLLGKFIFSMQKDSGASKDGTDADPSSDVDPASGDVPEETVPAQPQTSPGESGTGGVVE